MLAVKPVAQANTPYTMLSTNLPHGRGIRPTATGCAPPKKTQQHHNGKKSGTQPTSHLRKFHKSCRTQYRIHPPNLYRAATPITTFRPLNVCLKCARPPSIGSRRLHATNLLFPSCPCAGSNFTNNGPQNPLFTSCFCTKWPFSSYEPTD